MTKSLTVPLVLGVAEGHNEVASLLLRLRHHVRVDSVDLRNRTVHLFRDSELEIS